MTPGGVKPPMPPGPAGVIPGGNPQGTLIKQEIISSLRDLSQYEHKLNKIIVDCLQIKLGTNEFQQSRRLNQEQLSKIKQMNKETPGSTQNPEANLGGKC